MKQKYILIDTLNLYYRVRHTASRQASIDDKLGMSIHQIFMSANLAIRTIGQADHIIFAIDGRQNWRKEFYKPYKRQRADARQKRSEAEVEEDNLFFETLNNLYDFLRNSTNCSVIEQETAEADDVIARWIKLHPNDDHVIISSDSDFQQLVSENVKIFNGITKELITLDGYFDERNKPVVDKKTKGHKILKDPNWLLFEKCMRGDKSDNVFSAYPGVRTNGTKNKVGLIEAFADKDKKGYSWNNIQLHRWMDHDNKEHKVLDDYNRNVTLIDLDAQPQDIKDSVDLTIINTLLIDVYKHIAPSKVTFKFMKFCNTHDLVNLAKYSDNVIKWLSKPYKGEIVNVNN